MRFIKAFVWLIIVIVPFIGFLIALSYLELPMIGQGNPVANVSYYILDQNPNSHLAQNPQFRYLLSQKFIDSGVYKLLIFLFAFWIIISLIWILISEFLKIDLHKFHFF